MNKEKGTPKSLLHMAMIDALAAKQLAEEIVGEFKVLEYALEYAEELDIEMVLPLCKEAQAKLQAVANRTEQYAELTEGGSE
jgi:hypothetical protein